MTLQTIFPLCQTDEGVSHTCLSLCDHLRSPDLNVRVWSPTSRKQARRDFTRDVIPSVLQGLAYRVLRSDAKLCALTERRFLKIVRSSDWAYLWPGMSNGYAARLRQKVSGVVTERINCHSGTAARIMEKAYADLGWPFRSALAKDAPGYETEELSQCDAIFSPSPFVTQSLLDHGVSSQKILRTTYGWDPARLSQSTRAVPEAEGCTFVFVGRLCVRKGVPLLLRAWKRARIKGRLLLAGSVAPDVAERCATELNADGVVHLPFTRDVGAVYRSADVFAFPSHEEGSPLVMYEAMGVGLPSLISPIAAGEIVRDGVEGLHVDPNDVDALADQMNRLAQDADLRHELAHRARDRAAEFTWKNVAARRRTQLLQFAADRIDRHADARSEHAGASGFLASPRADLAPAPVHRN